MSIGSGSHPSMISAKASTLCLSDPEAFGYLVGADTNDQVRLAFQRAFASYATGDTKNPSTTLAAIRRCSNHSTTRWNRSWPTSTAAGYPTGC